LLVNLILSLVTVVIYRAQAPGVWVWEISATKLAAMLAVAAPIAVLGLLGALYQRTGIYLLSGMQGAAATGQFSAALRLVEAAKLGHFALLGAVFPLMAQAQAAPSVAFQALFAKTLRFLLLLAAGLSIFIFVLSPVLVPALFGAEFSESIAVLSILAWVLIPATLTHYYSLMLLSAKRERSILVALVVSVTILFISIVWVAPLWGLAAVAWAVVVAEVIQAAILFYYWRVQPPPEVGHAAA
jgi:O-antigen/teichoic acid export membrane protein